MGWFTSGGVSPKPVSWQESTPNLRWVTLKCSIYPESICETEKGCLQTPVLPSKSKLLNSGKKVKGSSR